MNDADDIIFFSDHGSPLFHDYSHIDDALAESFKLEPDYLWKPTLLLSSPEVPNEVLDNSFVTSQDLYYFVLRLALGSKYEQYFPSSALHSVLGGSLYRNQASTLLRRIGAHSLCEPNYISLVRHADDTSSIIHHEYQY